MSLEYYNETEEESKNRELEEARERMSGFTMKASQLPPNRPKPARPQISIWDRIELRLPRSR